MRVFVICFALCALAGGCGAARGDTPEATLASLSKLLRRGQYAKAYSSMSASYRERVSLEEFRQQFETAPAETRETIDLLSRIEGPVEQSATVRFADGDELELVKEGGAWRVATNLANFYDQSTPRDALRTFVRAFERERYDVVLRLVPNADREGMTLDGLRAAFSGEGREEVERLVATLRAHIEAPIEIVGDHATMPYAGRYEALLVREDGLWKVDRPE